MLDSFHTLILRDSIGILVFKLPFYKNLEIRLLVGLAFVFDNQDLCQLLNVDKKIGTIQAFRATAFFEVGGKIFYKYSEIVKVMQNLRKYDFDKENE